MGTKNRLPEQPQVLPGEIIRSGMDEIQLFWGTVAIVSFMAPASNSSSEGRLLLSLLLKNQRCDSTEEAL